MTHKPTESLWIATTESTNYRELREEVSVDVAIVGGGITGLTAGLRLRRAGKTVAILEINRVAEAESGHTTAHLTEQIDSRKNVGLPLPWLPIYSGWECREWSGNARARAVRSERTSFHAEMRRAELAEREGFEPSVAR